MINRTIATAERTSIPITVKKGFRKRTLQLCGVVDSIPEAKSYLEQQVQQSPEKVPTI
ncbi:MAG: hypothetical protein SWX82_04560 [Cyanobacteriota bacterium]|nr:hypothetical protein [Cyanobacteriota bacterium]